MSAEARSRVVSILLNGEERELRAGTVAELLAELGEAARPGLAVALNGEVVPRRRWGEQDLRDGDALEVVGAVQGG